MEDSYQGKIYSPSVLKARKAAEAKYGKIPPEVNKPQKIEIWVANEAAKLVNQKDLKTDIDKVRALVEKAVAAKATHITARKQVFKDAKFRADLAMADWKAKEEAHALIVHKKKLENALAGFSNLEVVHGHGGAPEATAPEEVAAPVAVPMDAGDGAAVAAPIAAPVTVTRLKPMRHRPIEATDLNKALMPINNFNEMNELTKITGMIDDLKAAGVPDSEIKKLSRFKLFELHKLVTQLGSQVVARNPTNMALTEKHLKDMKRDSEVENRLVISRSAFDGHNISLKMLNAGEKFALRNYDNRPEVLASKERLGDPVKKYRSPANAPRYIPTRKLSNLNARI